jgi:hypothetical protein
VAFRHLTYDEMLALVRRVYRTWHPDTRTWLKNHRIRIYADIGRRLDPARPMLNNRFVLIHSIRANGEQFSTILTNPEAIEPDQLRVPPEFTAPSALACAARTVWSVRAYPRISIATVGDAFLRCRSAQVYQ